MTANVLLSVLLAALTVLQSVSAGASVNATEFRSTRGESGIATTSRYDDRVAAEFSSAGTVQKSYLFAPESYWSTAPLALKQGGTYHYYHNDHLGTPRKLTNNVGAITWSARYSGYGIADVTESGANNPLRLPGQYADPESGLHHNYQRNYDPELGVYAEQDPYGVAWTGANRHLYANGEPMLGFDPTGEIVPAWVIWRGVQFVASEAYSGFPTFKCFQYLYDNCTYAQNGELCVDLALDSLVGFGAVRVLKAAKAGSKGLGLPKNPDELLNRGYKEVTHPNARAKGHRDFVNPTTGDKLRHDQGTPGEAGHRGRDHYHRKNPNKRGKNDEYLDADGQPCARGCEQSHLYPED